jgi:hypothetical protein
MGEIELWLTNNLALIIASIPLIAMLAGCYTYFSGIKKGQKNQVEKIVRKVLGADTTLPDQVFCLFGEEYILHLNFQMKRIEWVDEKELKVVVSGNLTISIPNSRVASVIRESFTTESGLLEYGFPTAGKVQHFKIGGYGGTYENRQISKIVYPISTDLDNYSIHIVPTRITLRSPQMSSLVTKETEETPPNDIPIR